MPQNQLNWNGHCSEGIKIWANSMEEGSQPEIHEIGTLEGAKMFSGQQHPDSQGKLAEVFSQASPVEVSGFEQAEIKQARIISYQLCGEPNHFERALAEKATLNIQILKEFR